MFNYNENTVKSFSLNNESVSLFQKYIWARHTFKFLFTCSTEDSHAINTMDSSKEKTLCLVSWNICGQQNPNIDHFSKELKADMFFLQETKIGPEGDMPLEKLDGWRCFFTVYDSKSKGVAILIKDCVPFQYLCHDEDYSGGYLVLFCHLHGELFTLVNVYNHKDDKEMPRGAGWVAVLFHGGWNSTLSFWRFQHSSRKALCYRLSFALSFI